jgi:hypothetical protein
MSKADSDTAANSTDEFYLGPAQSFLEILQQKIAGVTDEDIAKYWPSTPVAEGDLVLGVASRALQALNAARFQMADFAKGLIAELREMATDDNTTVGQINQQKYDILRAKSDYERWDELFWQTVSLEFGYNDDVALRADGTVVVPAGEDDLGRVDTILAFAVDYSESYLLICSLKEASEEETGE